MPATLDAFSFHKFDCIFISLNPYGYSSDFWMIPNSLKGVDWKEDALISKTLVRLVRYTHIGTNREGAASFDIHDLILSSSDLRLSDEDGSWFKT